MIATAKQIMNLGISEENNAAFNAKLKVQNIFSLSSIVLATPFIIYFIYIDFIPVSIIFLVTQLILILSLYLNKKELYDWSHTILTALILTILPTFSFVVGFRTGFYLYYFLTPIIFLSLFNLERIWRLYAIMGFVGLSFVICLILGYYHPIGWSELTSEQEVLIYWSNVVFGLIIITLMTVQLIVYYFRISNKLLLKNEQVLENQKQLKAALNDKEVLLKEVHHRVKNNLAIIVGLFNLQRHATENKETQEILEKNVNRIRSMSLIHDSLYSESNYAEIEFNPYLHTLIEEIEKTYSDAHLQIDFHYEIADLNLGLERAIPCGIIINELVINIYKHAFKGRSSGDVWVSLKEDDGNHLLIIKDNGIGYNPNVPISSSSLGISLIDALVDQIDGNIDVESNEKGTTVSISFP